MDNLNINLEDCYLSFINKELYKTKFYYKKLSYTPRVVFINKLYRSTYWFPANTGSILNKKKLIKTRHKPLYMSSTSLKLDFRSLFRLYLLVWHKQDVNQYIQSPDFLKTLTLLNETLRKQEFKKLLPKIVPYSFNTWKKPPLVNRYTYLNYFYDFSVHRVIAKFRKFNFLSINNWWLNKNWLFAIPNMRTRLIRRKKKFRYEYFMFRFFRLPGMSREYWAEQQLQYNYYNMNSFNLISDTYNSTTFFNHYPPLTTAEYRGFTPKSERPFSQLALLYWSFISAGVAPSPLPAYFSYSYSTHSYTYGSKYKYLKNYFAYLTPKYAHAYFSRFRENNFTLVVERLRWYMFLVKPTYWNLKWDLDHHPHEFWEWMDVSWWEDNINFHFTRFSKASRKSHPKWDLDPEDWLGLYNSNTVWLYKSWIHENLFLELSSSYYKRYYNFKYLTPGSRFQTYYPERKWGHFDPKWQDRLFEYTFHRHPGDEYFLRSTHRFIKWYSRSVPSTKLDSFIMLNFAWKTNRSLLFFSRQRPKPYTVNDNALRDPLRDFVPKFSLSSIYPNNFLQVLPVFTLYNNSLIMAELDLFRNNLVFLINFFAGVPARFNVADIRTQLNFLFAYLSYSGINNFALSGIDFTLFKGKTYSDLRAFVCELGSLSESDLFSQREQIIVEYLAFKRWHTLLISEYNNS